MNVRRIVGVLLALGTGGAQLAAQGGCNRTAVGACTIGNTATYAINITVTPAVRLALSSSSIALDAPGADEFDAGIHLTAGPILTVKANASWSVTIRTTQGLWTASAPPARQAKPAADLQWSTAAAGPFTDLTTAAASLGTGTASAGTVRPLYFRVKYSWTLDTPGTYSIPVQLTLSSP